MNQEIESGLSWPFEVMTILNQYLTWPHPGCFPWPCLLLSVLHVSLRLPGQSHQLDGIRAWGWSSHHLNKCIRKNQPGSGRLFLTAWRAASMSSQTSPVAAAMCAMAALLWGYYIDTLNNITSMASILERRLGAMVWVRRWGQPSCPLPGTWATQPASSTLCLSATMWGER